MFLQTETGEDASQSDLLEEAITNVSVRRVAETFHYLAVHAEVKQYYYELKFIRSGARFLELIGRALRNLEVLRRDKRYESEIKELWLPSKDDLAVVLKYYNALKTDFIKSLSGLVVARCSLCWKERRMEK